MERNEWQEREEDWNDLPDDEFQFVMYENPDDADHVNWRDYVW